MKRILLCFLLLASAVALRAQTFDLTAFDRPEGYELSVSGTEEIRLRIGGLAEGDYFGVQLRRKPGQGNFDFGALPAGTQTYRGKYISGRAEGSTLDVCLEALEQGPGTVYLTLRKGRGFDRFKTGSSAFAVENSRNLDSLLNTVFRNESCFELFPDTIITGDQITMDGRRVMQTGVFTGGMDAFGMESGIILSTGAVTDAVGPNTIAPRGQTFQASNSHADPDAASLIPPQFCTPTPQEPFCYEDVAIIEFEFVPTTDTISFNYIFFSEEYCFALNAGFGDAFAFFLEGPGVLPNGRANIARINGDRVSSETLNHIETPELFIDNSFNSFGPCTGQPNDPVIEQQTAYDGFSTKLQVKAAVIPCERYKLKLMVIDALDATLDSGILLEAGSFTAGLIAEPLPSVAGVPGSVTPVEACDTATLTFSRLFADADDLAQPLEVTYNLITTGTTLNLADNGLDFELPPSPFVIPAGDSTAVLKIPILGDADDAEGIEAFIIRYEGTCNCDQNRDTFWIQDATDLVLDLSPDQTVCAGETITLTASASGGAPRYAYAWPDGRTDPTIQHLTSGQDTTIVVMVTDSCGLTGTDSLRLIAPNVSAATGGTFSLCTSPTATVPVDVEGDGPFTITLRVDSGGTVTTTQYVISQDTGFVFSTDANISISAVTDAGGCGGSVSGSAAVIAAGVSVQSTVVRPRCGNANGSISLDVAGGNGNHVFSWDDDPGATAGVRTGLSAGIYSVDVARSDDPTCTQPFTFDLSAPPALTIDSISYVRPDCPGESLQLSPVVSGGEPPYVFSWPDSTSSDSTLTVVSAAGSTNYPVVVTDDCGVQHQASLTIQLPVITASLTGRYSLCNDAAVTVGVTVTAPDGNYFLALEATSAAGIDTIVRPFTQVQSTDQVTFTFTAATELRLLGIFTAAGCTGELLDVSASVVDPQLNFSGMVTAADCNGAATGSIELSDPGTVPLSFSWADGPTTQNRSGLTAGSYSLTITDAADPGCSRDTTFVIGQPSGLSLGVGSSMPACAGEADVLSPLVSGGTPPYTFNWPDSSSTDSLLSIETLPGTTTYEVVVTDACGASQSAMYVHDYPDVRAAVSGNFSVCNAPFNADVPILLSGSSSYTFTVRENGTERTLTASGDTILNYTTATVVQLVAVAGAGGCDGTAGGIANVTDGTFVVSSAVTDVACSGQPTGAISFVVNGNPLGYSYNWDDPQLSGNEVTGLTAGTYAVTATELSGAGCSWDTVFTITQPATSITLVQDSSRAEDCRRAAYADALYTGGTGTLTYRWSNGTTGSVLGEVPAGIYELSVTDDNGCTLIQTFSLADLRETPLADISASATELDCNQTSLSLTAQQNTVAVDYAWTDVDGTPLGSNRELIISSPGTYTVTATNPANGCTATDAITIGRSGEQLALTLAATHALDCINAAVDLTVLHPDYTDPVTYEWRSGATLLGTDATLPNVTATGEYTVTVVRSDNGCPTVATTQVVVDRDDPVVSLPAPTVTSNCRAPEVTIAVIGNGPYTYRWRTTNGNLSGDPGQMSTTADRAGTYVVAIRDTTNGCEIERTVTVVRDSDRLSPDAGPNQNLICSGAGTQLFGRYREGSARIEARWYGPAGTVVSEAQEAFATAAGDYVFEAIHPTSGCSSFDTVRVVDDGPTGVEYTLQQPPCPEIGGRLFVTSVTGNNGPFTFSSPTGEPDPFGNGLRGLREGSNVLIVTDQYGCELRDTFLIFDGENFTGTAPDVEIFLGQEATLGVGTNREEDALVSWAWANLPDSNACLNCPFPTLRPTESFVATVAVADTNGCTLELRQNVVVSEGELVYLPTAFSPGNGDGVNDVYTVFGDAEFVAEVISFGVFDRWGNQVFGNAGFSVNDPAAGWDGSFRGRMAPVGPYVYTVTVRYFDGREETLRGSFVLVR